MKPLDPTKPVQLRDGRQVRNVCWDYKLSAVDIALNETSIFAIVRNGAGYDSIYFWDKYGNVKGKYSIDGQDDLINIPEQVKGWVNVYPDSESTCMISNGESYISLRGWHKSKEEADRHALRNRIACHYISITVGEGLE